MSDMTRVYRKCGETVVRKVAGETLLIPIRGRLADMQRIFALDPVAEHIWEHLDGRADMRALVAALTARFEVDAAVAERDLGEFIAALAAEGLVAPAEAAHEEAGEAV